MGVREGLLALLAAEPKHGYQLKVDFEEATGDAWALNIGQVYSTLQRLERDGLVAALDGEEADRKTYEITAAGRAELEEWFATPAPQASAHRDELAMKVMLSRRRPAAVAPAVIASQRQATMQALQDYTGLKAATPTDQVAWLLHLDRLISQAEAELRWLDRAEERLAANPAAPVSTNEPVPEGGRV